VSADKREHCASGKELRRICAGQVRSSAGSVGSKNAYLPGAVLPVPIVVSLAVGLTIVVLLRFGATQLATQHWGRLALLVGLAVLPVLTSVASVSYGVRESSTTRFCLSCHEMQDHGKSLFADNPRALAATHYQNRLIDRDNTCYACHADYGLFGDVKAKLDGLHHVWTHYIGHVPEKLALYRPYKSDNCLHCHEDGRRFQEALAHKPVLSELYGGSRSCLTCHVVAHDRDAVAAQRFWQAGAR
jgi:nitrate/TMAO reductase-like tetraheme cytochrome c subunit